MTAPVPSLIALLHGPDQPGIVARVSNWIFTHSGNILHADQHRDSEEDVFFQRVEWVAQGGDRDDVRRLAEGFIRMARNELGMRVQVALSDERAKVGVLVSKIPHCLHDLIYRWRAGELSGDLVCVVSNHRDLQPLAETANLPFHHVPVSQERRADAEAAQLDILKSYGVGLVVMARYMQILSADFLERVGTPVINIHHGFLPAFPGGRPYHQAHARGVKIIGATAHYATAELDQGPIIAQDVIRINHRHTVSDLIRKGRHLEQLVFADAVRAHLEHRVLVYGHKTVVFE
ncbi:MAG: formyltetrahydrofolate deformylase [Verrucomicrobia bacterium]|nr:formyltetrahydrofolate deformylase [Verrucomicrobiota bacterium]